MLKKLAAAVGVSVTMLVCASAVTVDINDTMIAFDTPPEIISEHTMVPVRVIFETLGAEVEWDSVTQTVTATRGEDVIGLQIGSNNMTVNGSDVKLGIAPFIKNQKTLVPLRAISEALKCEVKWDGLKKAVHITDKSGLADLSKQYVTYSAFIDDVNGKPYCTRDNAKLKELKGFELVPLGYDDGMTPYNFCEYGEYVYYVSKTPGASGYRSRLYRCNKDWTGSTVLGDGTDITFIIDHNSLYWNGVKIDLSTLAKTQAPDPGYYIEGVSKNDIVSMTVHDSVCYYSKRDKAENEGILISYKNGKTDKIGSINRINFYLEGGVSGGHLYFVNLSEQRATLRAVPVNGEAVKFEKIDDHEKVEGELFFKP